MKRRTKLIAVLSATAILAAGVSITSFAESGWKEENGKWFWVDDNGQVAKNQLLEMDNNYYYVGEDGVNVTGQWVSIENENAGQEDEPDRHWYYFQENGKAYKRSGGASSGSVNTKIIDGKKYAFDTEGRMLTGWVSDGERQTSEDAWKTCDYYFGGDDDGVMRTGWERMLIVDDDAEKLQPGEEFWEAEQHRWFYFEESGKKVKGKENDFKRRTIHGNKYGFDEFGRMIASWYADPEIITTELARGEEAYDSETAQGGKNYTKKFMYFGSPESGVQYTEGWFRAVPSLYLMKQKHIDEDPGMYYADDKGYICANEIKTIDGEKYAFDNYGRQISGFVCLTMEDEKSSKNFTKKAHADDSYAPFSTEEEFDELIDTMAEDFTTHNKRFYLFYGPNNSMLTGAQKVTVGEEKYDFMFETDGYLRGSGVMGKKDGRLYLAGKLLKPAEGEKYAIYKQELNNYGLFYKMTVDDFIEENCEYGVYDEKKNRTVWEAMKPPDNVIYYLVDANGNIVKSKTKAKDSDGYEIAVSGHVIKSITMYD